MPVTTDHQFIDVYPIRKTDKRLIIGTIHPHLHENFLIPFFYGNVSSIWSKLARAFPERNFATLKSIIETLDHYKTSVTDMIRQCDRDNENITQDSLLYSIVLNTEQIADALNESQIDTIYFTSRFGRNNTAKLFINAFNIDYLETFDETLSEFTIPVNLFGRQIRSIVLYSPSGNAKVGISKSFPYKNQFEYYRRYDKPVAQFLIDFYREKFNYFNL